MKIEYGMWRTRREDTLKMFAPGMNSIFLFANSHLEFIKSQQHVTLTIK